MGEPDEMNMPNERLKFIRELRGYKDAEAFAQAFGINPVTYRKHETGERGLVRVITTYANWLKVHPQWLQFGTGDRDVNSPSDNGKPVDNVHVLSTVKRQSPKSGPQDFNQNERRERVPLHASVPGPGKGWLMLRNPSSYTEAIVELANIPDPRGYIMPSDEMDPVIVNGEILYPHPDKAAKNRSIVMIWLKKHPDEWFARELVSRNDNGDITVRKYGKDQLPIDCSIEWNDVKEMIVAIRER